MEQYLAIKRDGTLVDITTWMRLESMLSARSQSLRAMHGVTTISLDRGQGLNIKAQ